MDALHLVEPPTFSFIGSCTADALSLLLRIRNRLAEVLKALIIELGA